MCIERYLSYCEKQAKGTGGISRRIKESCRALTGRFLQRACAILVHARPMSAALAINNFMLIAPKED
jgi:hypothetical protein